MKYLKKIGNILIISLCLLNSAVIVSAEESVSTGTDVMNETSVSPRVQSVGYKYITIDGIKYRRLWSYSENCWLEPAWTPCE
ncbi:MAG: hypothetical protein Q4D26_07480 [Clostridia bacterium]|nr:hypothetical protein [Clostridia bacterium]